MKAPELRWLDAVGLANHRLDFLATSLLDTLLQRQFPTPPADHAAHAVRMAVLGTSTLSHLHAGIRVGALRRGIHVTTYENDFGLYRQELADVESALHAFAPNVVLFALDPWHLTAGVQQAFSREDVNTLLDDVQGSLVASWRQARDAFGCRVLQQTVVPAFPAVLGQNEHRWPASRADFVRRLNDSLRDLAESERVDLIAVDDRIGIDGLDAWHDIGLWHRSKQEVSPAAAPMYGDLVGRNLAAAQGRSAKCLVLDLDNTIWGGVIGDDGVPGIVLGQGSGAGEAFVAVQEYARDLSKRGIILAVVSKNDEANAIEAFDRHPDMILRRDDISCFVANWSDKAQNLRTVAASLNIGLDALVFLDDNPFERNLVRQELPMVAVPEIPDDPALFPRALADAGYFEGVGVTSDDLARREQYRNNASRDSDRAAATDLPSYLRSLNMRLIWSRFDRDNLSRIVQLANKTNQFNLTTRRYTEEEIIAILTDETVMGLQLRLVDKYGDNGIIALLIGRLANGGVMEIETWLMSCRVLGREVEMATLNVLAAEATAMGATRLVGTYLPTAKNAMVRDHYSKLGFSASDARDRAAYTLDLADYQPRDAAIKTEQG